MARAIKWQLPFMSLNGTAYTVNIYEQNYTGDIIQLRGSSTPFETQEDTSDNFFKPVRTQSGYIRIVYSDGLDTYDWSELIPNDNHSHYVELVSGTDVKWIGYMKAEGYDHDAFGRAEEYEFPIISAVESVQGYEPNYNSNYHFQSSMGSILYDCLNAAGVSFGNCYFSNNTTDLKELNAIVDTLNFMELNDDYNVTAVESDSNRRFNAQKNYLEIIEAICQFYGWTLHEYGKDLIFKTPDKETSMVYISFADLANTGRTVNTCSSQDAITPTYVNASSQMSFIRGRKSISIEANINVLDSLVELPLEEWPQFGDGQPQSQEYSKYTEYFNYFDWYFTNSRGLWNKNIDQKFKSVRFITTRKSSNNGINLFKYDSCSASEISKKVNYSLTNGLRVVCMTGTDLNKLWETNFVLETLDDVCVNDGALTINGSVKGNTTTPSSQSTYLPKDLTDKTMPVYFSVGDKYWTGTSWSTTRTSFNITFDSGSIKTVNKTLSQWSYNGATGYVMAVGSEKLCGRIRIEFDTPTIDGISEIVFDELKVENVKAKINDKESKSSNTYTSYLNENLSDEESVSLCFATFDHNKIGRGILHNSDYSNLTTIAYVDETTRPEQRLLSRMSAWYKNTQKKMSINVRREECRLYPSVVIGSDSYHILSIENKWVDDQMNIIAEKTN